MKRQISIVLIIITLIQSLFTQTIYAQSFTDSTQSATSSPSLETLLPITETPAIDSLSNVPQLDITTPLPPSAKFRPLPRIKRLLKKTFKAGERVSVTVQDADILEIDAKLEYSDGSVVEIDTQEIKQGDNTEIRIIPPNSLKPGKYKLIVNANGQELEEDFSWGVLAINTNKSIYLPSETANLAIAVLDDKGEMVCDASLVLKITDPSSSASAEFSTDNGQIKTSPTCTQKAMILEADYGAVYKVSGPGTYSMMLSATTSNGTYTIDDSFEVRESVDFDIERITATRLYPPETYPVTFKMKANRDFTGIVTEIVPNTFGISQLEGSIQYKEVKASDDESLKKEQVLGTSTIGYPFEGEEPITLGFGKPLRDPLLKKAYFKFGLAGHDGIDFGLEEGTPVLSVDDGEVVKADTNGAYGSTIVIEHSWGRSYYGHLSEFLVEEGQKVSRGGQIALSGSTGLSTGPHLHFGIKLNENNFENGFYGKSNPAPFLGIHESEDVLGVSTTSQTFQVISWDISVKKGEEITFGYKFKAPNISPQLYRLGPLRFYENGAGGSVFEETRQWKLAIDAANRIIEQQINIIDQEYSSASTTYVPTDNSLGLIRWDSAKYNGDTVYFEAVLKNQNVSSLECGTASVALFSSTGTQVTGSAVSTTSLNFTRVRSSALTLGTLPNLESGIDYTVRFKCSSGLVLGNIKAARLIIVQSDAASITDTQTQVEVGNNETTTGTTYADLTDKKIYRYTSSVWSPSPTAYFEASIKDGTPVTPSGPNSPSASTDCIDATGVGTVTWTNPGNAFSDNATYATASVDGTTTHYIKCTNFGFALPSTATVVGIVAGVERKSSSTGNGGSKDAAVRIVKGGTIGATDKSTATTYTTSDVFEDHGSSTDLWGETWAYTDINASTFGLAFAATKASGAGAAHTVSVDTIRITVYYTVPNTAYAALYTSGGSVVTGSEVSTTGTSWTRLRSSSITLSDATDYVVRVKTTTGGTAAISNAKIIFDQTQAGGISALETVHQQINTVVTDSDAGYTLQNFHNEFNPANWSGGTFNYYLEATMKTSGGINIPAQLYNITDSDAIDTPTNSRINTSNTIYERVISADLSGNSDWPSAAKTLDTQISGSSAPDTLSVSSSQLVIKVTGLTAALGPTNDQLMRHGKWLDSGTENAFTF